MGEDAQDGKTGIDVRVTEFISGGNEIERMSRKAKMRIIRCSSIWILKVTTDVFIYIVTASASTHSSRAARHTSHLKPVALISSINE
jgi:hypothetical protein